MEDEHIIDPKPGSEAAGKAGCTCPVIDNHHGRGVPHNDQRRFWIAADCPLHGKGPRRNE